MANLKNITELPVAESAEGLNLIVNDNGAAKQIAANSVVGKVKTINGVEPDENGNVEIDIPEGFSGNSYDVVIVYEGDNTATEGIFEAIVSGFDSQKPVNVNAWKKGTDNDGYPCFWRLNITQIINLGKQISIEEDSGGVITIREDGWINYYND